MSEQRWLQWQRHSYNAQGTIDGVGSGWSKVHLVPVGIGVADEPETWSGEEGHAVCGVRIPAGESGEAMEWRTSDMVNGVDRHNFCKGCQKIAQGPKPRGGARKGAGRKPKVPADERVTLRKTVSRRHIEALERWGEKHGLTDTGDALRHLLDAVRIGGVLPSEACEQHAAPECAPDVSRPPSESAD